MNLKGKTVVLTGGSLGIGLAVGQELARREARVILAARNRGDLDAAEKELNGISAQRHLSYVLDVSCREAVDEFAGWCGRQGDIHGLVNCAGVYGPIGKTGDVPMSDFARAIEINLLGTVYTCHAFLPLLLKSKSSGHRKILNFSGGGAATPFPNYSAYATSKAGVVRFTENIAEEYLSENVEINCIAPGFVLTRFHQQTLQAGDRAGKFLENTKKQMAEGGVPPEKAAKLVAFLLSEAGDGITGKFLSAPWDPWEEREFQERLRRDKHFATLRRIDEKQFFLK